MSSSKLVSDVFLFLEVDGVDDLALEKDVAILVKCAQVGNGGAGPVEKLFELNAVEFLRKAVDLGFQTDDSGLAFGFYDLEAR